MKRLLPVFFALAVIVVVPFLIWGGDLQETMSLEETVAGMRAAGRWAWLAGITLLVLDLFLPIPGTVVMSALGLIYGWFLGGVLAATGSIASGLLAYGISIRLGRPAARWLAGSAGLAEGEKLFHGELGGWLVALSRWMPVLPEVIACLAGISRMPFRLFATALCAGSIPMGFVFAWIGHGGEDNPLLALSLSAGLPPVLWALFQTLYLRRARRKAPIPRS